MFAEEDENDFLGDDDFDGLDDQDLVKLEQDAIRSTQQMQPVQGRREVFARNATTKRGPWNGQAPSSITAPAAKLYQNALAYQSTGSLDEAAYADDGGVATPVDENRTLITRQHGPGEMEQREQWRQQRYSNVTQPLFSTEFQQPQPRPSLRRAVPPKDMRYRETDAENMYIQERSYTIGPDDSMVLDLSVPAQNEDKSSEGEALRIRLEELTRELESAKEQVLKQQGEISVVRAQRNNEQKLFDRQVAAWKKDLRENKLSHAQELERLRQEKAKLTTENTFLQQEVADEARKTKTLNRTLQARPTSTANERPSDLNTTPKKAHVQSLRDGFNDEEIVMGSPVKSGGGRKSKGTPTGGKRKRKTVDSTPLPALALRQSGSTAPVEEQPIAPPKQPEKVLPIIKKDKIAERNLKFMQRILNHQTPNSSDRILETCMQYSYSTEPSKTFTSLILAATARLPPSDPRFKPELLAVFVDMWAKCLKLKYYRPIPLLTEVVSFILALESSVVDEGTIKLLLPVLQNCGKINATARWRHSPLNKKLKKLTQTPQSEITKECDTTRCLEMLYDIATLCRDKDSLIERFWRTMDTDFVLVMLCTHQTIADMTLMLHLLSTSIFPTTFGNICSGLTEQTQMENYIIHRTMYLLWETPRVDAGLPKLTRSEICTFRLEVMSLLSLLIFSTSSHPHDTPSHGSAILADEPSALALLVRSIYDEVDAMYLHRASAPLHAALVNRGVSILYHLLALHPSIDLSRKLSATNGGVHKHRVVLSRLGFSDGGFLDQGITDETVGFARDMLEKVVTPEEAAELLDAFPEFARRLAPTPSQPQVQGQIEEYEDETMRQ